MYAIVEIAGQQFKVEEGQAHFVHQLEANEGDQVSFDRVLMVDNEGTVTIGTPTVSGTVVTATVLSHVKGDKVIVFKKKRRKGYKKKNGHRQSFTRIQINAIGAGIAAPSAAMAAAAEVTEADNLTKIEGIGPKIAGLLNDAGINSFADLATQSEEALKEILTNAGGNYGSKNPSTWAAQSQMAADGKWDELKVLQDELDGGVAK
jgi:large subunit ribosomal protein L21